ncbi:family 78 glycoside hydrolase catalytic domain [Lewinella sp. W8]|uniref:family 78 glycoside hydrolase catalytic domain n=1 Tax=Lewinella sp. W8 TaxID=2528208 RepID=UPI001565F79F|nr:family 78 glycoside hydrolase catalytic domain [Lewinella sp. W8]
MRRSIFFFLLSVLLSVPLAAQWSAEWISHPDVGSTESAVVLFRTEFELASVPDSFPVDLTADNHFRLYVNGEWVAWGPQLGDIQHWRYDHHDLSSYLRPGRNVVAIEVFNWGQYRFFGMESVHTALLVQGYGASEVLTTRRDQSNYRCRIKPGYRTQQIRWRQSDRDIIGGLYANNPTDIVVGPAYPWGWEQPDYSDGAWEEPVFVEWGHLAANGGGFLWLLEPRNTPPMVRSRQSFKTLRQSQSPALPKGWWLGRQSVTLPANGSYRFLLDMGEVTLGFPTLQWSGGRGTKMVFTWAENLFLPNGEKTHRDTVRGTMVRGYFDTVYSDGGKNRKYVPSWYRTFRYLEIKVHTGREPLELLAPTFQRVTSSIPVVATWSSDDPELDEIMAISQRTVELCTQDYFLSDAYYETMQYIGDTKIQAPVWELLTGDRRHTRNALRDFHRGRNPDGVLKSAYPNRYQFYHSTYSLVWIDMLLDYYRRSGDAEFVREFLPGVRHTLAYFDRYFDEGSGFLGEMPYRPFIDWYVNSRTMGIAPGADPAASVPVTLHYAHALRSAIALHEELRDAKDTEDWERRLASIQSSIRDQCYVPERKLLAERPAKDYFDQHSSILGVLLDVIPPEDVDAALERLLRDPELGQATYYYRYYLFSALREAKRPDLFREALRPWRELVALGATTLVERLESPIKPTRSEAHPWGASPVLFAYGMLAGIDYERHEGPIRMSPTFGHLTSMEGFVPVRGPENGVKFRLMRQGTSGIRGTVTAGNTPVVFSWKGQEWMISAGDTLELE